jgi:hypothetical protein
MPTFVDCGSHQLDDALPIDSRIEVCPAGKR